MVALKKTDLIERAPTEAYRMEQYKDSEGKTRYKMVIADMKFGEEAKASFLAEFAEHGRLGTAARKSGVTIKTVQRHIEKDPLFGQLVAEALECYKDRLIKHHQNLVFKGTEKVSYDRNGNIVSTERVYPVRLIELELKKHDEGYRDKKDVTVQVKGGVLVAPAEISMEEWSAKFGAKPVGDIVDAEIADVVDSDDLLTDED